MCIFDLVMGVEVVLGEGGGVGLRGSSLPARQDFARLKLVESYRTSQRRVFIY